jgi:hypothetical protein
MSKKLLFLGLSPDERYKMNGVVSRIKAVDSHFLNDTRTYLYVSLIKNIRKYHHCSNKLEVYELNFFFHFFTIAKILYSSNIVYAHSIHHIKNIWCIMLFYKGNLFLDAHGVVPEEVKYFEGNLLSFWYMSLIEKIVFAKRKLTVICVTKAMQDHFSNKYPNFKGKFILYNIFPVHFDNLFLVNNNKKQSNDKVTIIYTGGSALWQKIDLMLDVIEKNQTGNIEYIILTGDLKEFEYKISKRKINKQNIELKTVLPKELVNFYQKADFGFLLRDDNIVNQVASPTKMIEYLSFGIIPIVVTPNIGDYLSYSFEFLTIDKFNTAIKKPDCKSAKNISIAQNLLNKNNEIDIRSIVFAVTD